MEYTYFKNALLAIPLILSVLMFTYCRHTANTQLTSLRTLKNYVN